MRGSVLRRTDVEESPRVTNLELFFDLVYVFAITQVSDFLFDNLSARGALETVLLFHAVWWAWNYTAWATNWIDPDQPRVALLLLVMMALGLIVAAALPHAYGHRGAPFAVAYAALQVLRGGFVVAAFPGEDRMRANNLRLFTWLVVGGAGWVLGACLHGDARLIAWTVTVAVEIAAPLVGFWLPGRGMLAIEHWRLTGTHLAERYQLVLIIALGETVLRVGLTFSDEPWSFSHDIAFLVGLGASAALWAVYFLRLAERGAERVAREGAARLGRSGYAYAHAFMVAGVIVVAVAIRTTIMHPEDPAGLAFTWVALGGPALYLAGLALFERAARVASPAGPLGAVGVLALLCLPALAGADQLVLLSCAAVVLLALVGVAKLLPRRRGRREAV